MTLSCAALTMLLCTFNSSALRSGVSTFFRRYCA